MSSKEQPPVGDKFMDENITPPLSSSPSPLAAEDPTKAVFASPRDPTPAFSDGEDDEDDDWQPQSHSRDRPEISKKRKYRATLSKRGNTATEAEVPEPSRRKNKLKMKAVVGGEAPPDKPSPKPKKIRPYDATRQFDRIANAEQVRLVKLQNKHLKAMGKWDFIKIDKAAAKVPDYKNDLKTRKDQVKALAPSLIDRDRDQDRDIGGKRNKFDLQKAREAVTADKISEWRGKKWTDENEANITWSMIPTTQKYLSLYGRMVAVEEILSRSAQFPELEYVVDVKIEHPKTKKIVIEFYKNTYEKMDMDQATVQMGVMAQKAKAAADQRKKDQAAERRRASKIARRSGHT